MVASISELELAYSDCRDLTRREAKNFYYAFVTLPLEKRKAIYAAYAFLPPLRRLCGRGGVPRGEAIRSCRAAGQS